MKILIITFRWSLNDPIFRCEKSVPTIPSRITTTTLPLLNPVPTKIAATRFMTMSSAYFPSQLGLYLYSQVLSSSGMCDVTIETADQPINCHSAVISMASDLMKEMINLATANEKGVKTISFNNASSESIFCVLNYIYTGQEVII